eukprot:1161695-Pelagomonas_calceolata.AAC.7
MLLFRTQIHTHAPHTYIHLQAGAAPQNARNGCAAAFAAVHAGLVAWAATTKAELSEGGGSQTRHIGHAGVRQAERLQTCMQMLACETWRLTESEIRKATHASCRLNACKPACKQMLRC